MKQTRRQLIKSLAGIAVSVSGAGRAVEGTPISDGINTNQKQMNSHDNRNMKRKAYVTLPSFGMKYLYANLHELMGNWPRPVIIMDSYDYDRLWGQIVMERHNRPIQMLGMITDALRRRGLIKTLDYGTVYSAGKQQRNVVQCRNAVESLPDHKQQAIAEEFADGFFGHFQRLDYQESFRKSLQDWDHAHSRRDQVDSQMHRLKSGGDDPARWAERTASQYVTALEVRRAVEKHFDFNSVEVIGQGENEGVSALLRDSSFTLDRNVATLRQDGQSIKEIFRFNPDTTAYERDILDSVSHVAQKAAGTQHNDWFLLGSQVAVPHFPKLFVESWSEFDSEIGTPVTELAAETREILSRLERRAADNHPAHLDDNAQAIAEQHGVSSEDKVEEISNQLNRAVNLANYTPALRELSNDSDYTSASIMTAASILMDPNRRVNEDMTYRRAWQMKQRHDPVSVPQYIVTRFSERGGHREGREQRGDWYQSVERVRV